MRLKDTKTVKAMIDRMNAQGGTEVVANPELVGDEAELTGLEVAGTKYKVEGSGVPSMLELNTSLAGALPIEQTITDEEDIAKLNAIETAFAENGTLPPLYYKTEFVDTDRICSLAMLTSAEITTEATVFHYVLPIAYNTPTDYYVFAKADNVWIACLYEEE